MARDRLAGMRNNGGDQQQGWEQDVQGGGGYNNEGYGNNYNNDYNQNQQQRVAPPRSNNYQQPPQQQQQYNNNYGGGSSSNNYPPPQHPQGNQQDQQAISNARAVLRSPAETLDEFFRQQDAVTELIRIINNNTQEVQSLNQRSLNEVSQSNVAQLRQRIDETVNQQQQLIELARSGVNTLKSSKRGDKNVRKNLYKTSLENLRSAVQNFYRAQKEVERTNKDQITRQIKIADPSASEDQIRAAVEDGRTDVFTNAILSSRVADKQRILGAVQDRDRALRKIAESMAELANLVNELNFLINEQQEMIDLIDQRTEEAVVNVRQGDEALAKAITSAKSARSKKWTIFWIILVILIIVGAVIGIYIAINKKNN